MKGILKIAGLLGLLGGFVWLEAANSRKEEVVW
jgi:hypothetical protein